MTGETSFKFGEGGYECMKNVIMATIADYAEMETRPDEEKLMREMELMLGSLPSLYRMGIVWILRALEMAPFAMGFRKQFSNLDRDEQVQVLDAFEKSANYVQRGIILALKSLVLMIYFSEPEVEQALGYDHKCLVQAR
jgi:hypothetical protein